MKILHIISGDLWAGAEVQAFTLLNALRKIDGVEVRAALLNEGELARKLRAHDIRVDVFPENTMNAMALFLALRRLMKEWRPGVVHTHRIKENILGALANRFATRAKSLRTAHGASEHPPRGPRDIFRRVLRFLDRWTGNHLQQRVVAVSRELRDKLHRDFDAKKIVVVENGIDLEAVRSRARGSQPFQNILSFCDSAPLRRHIGLVGRLVPVKRVDLFLDTAKLMTAQSPGAWHFHIFGDGPLRSALGEQAARLGLENAITFHGHRDDIDACIAALDALVMCSDHEGMPMTLLEAMCLGTRVIGHDVGGIKELLRGGDNGWPVSEHSARGYAQALRECFEDEHAQRRVAAAKQLVAQYSADICAQHYLDIYRDLANHRG